jgi:cytochrome c553
MQKIISTVFFLFSITLHADAVVCAACHGAAGISSIPMVPHLAGQQAAYLAKQLRDYQQDQGRHSAVMMPFAAGLSTQDQQDLAAFYASLPPPHPSTPGAQQQRGEQLYRQGDNDKHITACIACHGPQGLGNANAGFPRVAGQQADYTRAQLQAFKQKNRENDINAMMRFISRHMDEEDITAVADYMAAMH